MDILKTVVYSAVELYNIIQRGVSNVLVYIKYMRCRNYYKHFLV